MGKTHKQSIFDDKFLFQKAYKKLKSDAYYDKTKVILKKDLVEFENENEEKLDMQLSDIQNQLINADNDVWEKYINEKILNGIKCIILPKKLSKIQKRSLALFLMLNLNQKILTLVNINLLCNYLL